MFEPTITQRLLWKDYRSLRVVWLTCALGMMGLMLLIVLIQLTSLGGRIDPSPYWGLAVWVPPIYILAALATMFAGAREEGTLTWLTILAPPPRTLIKSQLLFVVITGIALHLVLTLAAAVITQGRTAGTGMGLGGNLATMLFLVIEATMVGWFWSLLTSKALPAILAAAVSIIVLNLVWPLVMDDPGGRAAIWSGPWGNALGIWGWGRLLLYAALVPVCVRLTERWLDGQPWEWNGLTRWRVARRTATVPALAIEPSESWQRVWQRLRWLEWQAMRPWKTAVRGAAVLSVLSLLLGSRPAPTLAMTLVWLIPFVAGLAAWQGEQNQARFRMLVYRGASPQALWLNKLVLWLGGSLLSILFTLLVTFAAWEILAYGELWWRGLHSDQRWRSVLPRLAVHHPWPTPTLYDWLYMGNGILIAFVLPFACSHFIQRTIVAFGASWAAAFLFTPWMILITQYQLPPLLCLTPIPLWLLWLSWRSLPAWWLERTSWRLTRREGVELSLGAMFPFVLLALTAGYRVWEVPYVSDQMLSVLPGLPEGPPTLASRIPATQDAIQGWPAVMATVRDLAENRAGAVYFTPPPELVRSLAAQILAQSGMPVATSSSPLLYTSNRNISILACDSLMHLASEQLAEGDRRGSIDSVRAALRLAGASERNQGLYAIGYIENSHHRPLWRGLQRWVQHPQQNEATLTAGLKECAAELPFWQTQPGDLEIQHSFDLDEIMAFWPWERARAERLINLGYFNRLSYLQLVRRNYVRPSYQIPDADYLYPLTGNRYVSFRAGRLDGHDEYRPVGLDYSTIRTMFDREHEFRVQLSLAALIGYRHIHGSLPPSLDSIAKWFDSLEPRPAWSVRPLMRTSSQVSMTQNPSPLVDLGSGVHFGYEPEGFPVGGAFAADSVYRQPLLWSTGFHRVRVIVRNGSLELWSDYSTFPPRTITHSDTEDEREINWIFPIPEATPTAASEETNR